MGKQYNISALEKRRDWMLILMSQPCPEQGCGAIAGENCWQVSSALGGFGQRSQRQDFHASRKYAAAQYLEEHPLTTVPVNKEETVKSLEQQAAEEVRPKFEHKEYGVVGQVENGVMTIKNSPDGGPLPDKPKRTRKSKSAPTSE